MKGLWYLCALCAAFPVLSAADWDFAEPRVIAEVSGQDQWLQLQSSGRKNIAATPDRVGMVYERYDREKAEVYLATAALDALPERFAVTTVDDSDRPHDPVIRAEGDRFVIGWLDKQGAWLRVEQGGTLSEPLRVRDGAPAEFTLATAGTRVHCVWTERAGDRWRLMARTATFGADGKAVLSDTVAVAPLDEQNRQRRPAAAVVDGRVVVAWQDRSTGTSVLYAAVAQDGLAFGKAVAVNETIVKSADWGKGSSAIDGTFATSADGKLVLAWLDKRGSRSGYKVYASVNRSLKDNDWKVNQKVQDEFGDFTPQWNIALSDSATDRIVAAWSDSREETPDIWIADYQGGLWDEDQLVDPAGTENSETDPSLAIDAGGRLHLIWLVAEENVGQRILYTRATR